MRVRALLLTAACVAGVVVISTAPPSAAITTPVDITVTLKLDGAADRQFAVEGVVPGPGFELTEADEVVNEDGLCGVLEVDIDPDAQTITLLAGDGFCSWSEAYVRIDTTELTAVELVSDNALVGADMTQLEVSDDNNLGIAYLPEDGPIFSINDPEEGTPGTTVLSYSLAGEAEPEAALAPSSVEAGAAVTVEGTLCPSGPIMATIAPEGGAPFVDDEEQTVADEAGDWSFEVDTDGLAPGTYTVAVRCVQADLAGFDYEVLSFTVTAPGAEPAEPVPAEPNLTG